MLVRGNVAEHLIFEKIACDNGMEASTVIGTVEVPGVCIGFN